MFRRWSSTDADRSGTACRHDTTDVQRPPVPSTTATARRRDHHRSSSSNAGLPSHYVMAIGAILVLAMGAPPGACHAKQSNDRSRPELDGMARRSTDFSSSASLLNRQKDPRLRANSVPPGANNVQETQWPPMRHEPSAVSSSEVDYTDYNTPLGQNKSLDSVNLTISNPRDRIEKFMKRLNLTNKRSPPEPAYVSDDKVSPALSTMREVNDSVAGSVRVRPPRLYRQPLPIVSASAEDYGGDGDDKEEPVDQYHPTPSRGRDGGGRGGPGPDALLKSSKEALIVTKKSHLKKDWCKTQMLVQRVREDGCHTRRVINRFCYGQCNSFYIPRTTHNEHDMGASAFKSCSFCKPKRSRWITITLHCPGQNPPIKKKRIQRIKKCTCTAENL